MTRAAFPMPLRETGASDPRRTIPFDYAFRYQLEGKPGKVVNQTVTVSIEATFIAVSIGYGVVPALADNVFGPVLAAPISASLRDLKFDQVIKGLALQQGEGKAFSNEIGPNTAAVLTSGVKLNPQVAELALLDGGRAGLDPRTLDQLFQPVAAPPDQIQFLYAIFDEGSGREFQSDPILNIAGLGISNGDRPFRYFARPIEFAPKSTVRLQVTEVSEFKGDLHVSLHGYKVLGGTGTPTGRVQRNGTMGRKR